MLNRWRTGISCIPSMRNGMVIVVLSIVCSEPIRRPIKWRTFHRQIKVMFRNIHRPPTADISRVIWDTNVPCFDDVHSFEKRNSSVCSASSFFFCQQNIKLPRKRYKYKRFITLEQKIVSMTWPGGHRYSGITCSTVRWIQYQHCFWTEDRSWRLWSSFLDWHSTFSGFESVTGTSPAIEQFLRPVYCEQMEIYC